MTDWQVGDLALCVRDSASGSVLRGRVYAVTHVSQAINVASADGIYNGVRLCLSGAPDWNGNAFGYRSILFRKITPGAKIEGFEEPRRLPVKEQV